MKKPALPAFSVVQFKAMIPSLPERLRTPAFILFTALVLVAASVFSPPTEALAFSPIIIVLAGMLLFQQGGQTAGPVGFIAGLMIASQHFGLTPQILAYSQWKGLNLTLFIISILFPALVLYGVVNHAGGFERFARAMSALIPHQGILWLVVAWAFSAIMEGVAGFGLPIAVAAPILIGMGMDPLLAVASVAVGHSWSVTYGDMGAIYLTLHQLVRTPTAEFAPYAAIFFGAAILLTGWAVTRLQGGQVKLTWLLLLSGGMITTQSLLTLNGMASISDLATGLVGIAIGALISRRITPASQAVHYDRSLRSAIFSYGALAAALFVINSFPPIHEALASIEWRADFPSLTTTSGYTSKPSAQVYHPLLNTGLVTFLVAGGTYLVNRRWGLYRGVKFSRIMAETTHLSWQAILGIAFMVGLSNIMDFSGMSLQMAEVVSSALGRWVPLISPLIGNLGAFASGSNTNSNVLFASMQENIGLILGLSPAILVAAQTAGGSLGSMIAPAKIIVGCTTANLRGREGEVIRLTLPYALLIGGLTGLLTLGLTFLK